LHLIGSWVLWFDAGRTFSVAAIEIFRERS